MVLIREAEFYSCVQCGSESLFSICPNCVKDSAKKYDETVPFPNPKNHLEVSIARFLIDSDDFDEAAAVTAIAHYTNVTLGYGYYLISSKNVPKEDAQAWSEAQEKWLAEFLFLKRVLLFLSQEPVQKNLKEKRVVTVKTLTPITQEVTQKLEKLLDRVDTDLLSEMKTNLHIDLPMFYQAKFFLMKYGGEQNSVQEPSKEPAAD